MGYVPILILIMIVVIIVAAIGQLLLSPRQPKRRLPNLNPSENARSVENLTCRLGCSLDILQGIQPTYQEFTIPKRSGGQRRILAPDPELKKLQRTILKRLLNRLRCHPTATGFEKGFSIATNAFAHVGADVVLRMDIKDFFTSTTEDRLRGYLYGIGWGQEAADILIRLCTYEGSLPQGAPTSPRLSNLVNAELDARLNGWASKVGAVYTRYADDITFSFHNMDQSPAIKTTGQNPKTLEKASCGLKGDKLVTSTIRVTKNILAQYGYTLHIKRKLNIRRSHQQQTVTGLVVNQKVNLPRKTRRWLRAVKHHLETGKPATLTPEQLAGWQSFQQMIRTHSKD